MNIELVTKEDLKLLEVNLVKRIIEQLKKEKLIEATKKWLKTKDLEDQFGVCKGKQDGLRKSRKIPFSKLGDTVYYSYYDIDQILEANKTQVE